MKEGNEKSTNIRNDVPAVEFKMYRLLMPEAEIMQ